MELRIRPIGRVENIYSHPVPSGEIRQGESLLVIAEEFGPGLQREFLSFEKLMDPGMLADVKLLTNALEQRWSLAGRRPINLDPGYISPEKLVLATTKNHGHRIYLGRGVYAEVTLAYRNKAYRPWPWTYPDYRSEAYLEIMQAIRRVYMGQLRELHRDPGATPR